MVRTLHETKLVHPLVAHILEENDWCYLHEYRLWPGIVDFVGIHRPTKRLALIECKKAITSAWDVVSQVNGYHRVFGYERTMQIVFTVQRPSKETIRVLKAKHIQIFGVELDAPSVTQYQTDTKEFHDLLHTHHVKAQRVKSEVPAPPLPPVRVAYPLPPLPPLRPGIWPKNAE